MEEKLRLQKYLAMANVASRRASEAIILEGRVKVNGCVVTELGTKVSANDKVEVDGELVFIAKKKYYIMLNKPSGYVTTASDEMGRKTVLDLISDINDRVYPIGRLDKDTEGLLLLTNDGDFAYEVAHPKHNVEKVYHAFVSGVPGKIALSKLEKGVIIDGIKTKSAYVDVLEVGKNSSVVEIKIHEGRNRQVRKMFEAVGHKVIALQRVAVGKISLGNLPIGKWRHLTEAEIKILKS
ncbi:MAG: rRNA pseudouridine synthase [Ruminococcaceae bacterium]|nr:rRNA pseudouridine synthase [Oscillospiraceae bacterium]